MSFWYPFLELHLTTYVTYSNIGDCLPELGTSTVLSFLVQHLIKIVHDEIQNIFLTFNLIWILQASTLFDSEPGTLNRANFTT